MTIPPATYKTFPELAEYAKARAKHSAARRGHQEFAYWANVANWAGSTVMEKADPAKELKRHLDDQRFYGGAPGWSRWMADSYAKCVHCCKMIRNRGGKPPRLSLKWLREAAEKL